MVTQPILRVHVRVPTEIYRVFMIMATTCFKLVLL